MNPNGNVDRLTLAANQETRQSELANDASMESRILALWSVILDQPVNDPTANFFDLGGNSIHLAVVHVRLMEMIGRKFAITELFALPSARDRGGSLSKKPECRHEWRTRPRSPGTSRFLKIPPS
jgi:hypothetical protein